MVFRLTFFLFILPYTLFGQEKGSINEFSDNDKLKIKEQSLENKGDKFKRGHLYFIVARDTIEIQKNEDIDPKWISDTYFVNPDIEKGIYGNSKGYTFVKIHEKFIPEFRRKIKDLNSIKNK